MRTVPTAVVSLLQALTLPPFAVVAEFSVESLKLANRSGVTFGGVAYTAATMRAENVGENFVAQAEGARLVIGSLAGEWQERFNADALRGTTVTLRVLVYSSGAWVDSTFRYTHTIDVDEIDADEIRMRLGSSDAVRGTSVPRQTTQEAGCQLDFQRGECWFRWRDGMAASLKECDKTYDGPNGCREHFPNVTIDGQVHVIPKPFRGFLGGIAHRLVLR